MNITASGSVADTSPDAVAARRRERTFRLQDRALELHRAGESNRDIGRILDVRTPFAATLAGVAGQRQTAMRHSVGPGLPDGTTLKEPEIRLLKALLSIQYGLWELSETRSPESRSVAWKAGRSQGWVTSTARRRIATEILESRGTLSPGLGLVSIAGNGYLNLTARGWSACRSLFPERFERPA